MLDNLSIFFEKTSAVICGLFVEFLKNSATFDESLHCKDFGEILSKSANFEQKNANFEFPKNFANTSEMTFLEVLLSMQNNERLKTIQKHSKGWKYVETLL